MGPQETGIGHRVVVDSQMLVWFKEKMAKISEQGIIDNEFLSLNQILSCLEELSQSGVIETEEQRISYELFASIYY